MDSPSDIDIKPMYIKEKKQADVQSDALFNNRTLLIYLSQCSDYLTQILQCVAFICSAETKDAFNAPLIESESVSLADLLKRRRLLSNRPPGP